MHPLPKTPFHPAFPYLAIPLIIFSSIYCTGKITIERSTCNDSNHSESCASSSVENSGKSDKESEKTAKEKPTPAAPVPFNDVIPPTLALSHTALVPELLTTQSIGLRVSGVSDNYSDADTITFKFVYSLSANILTAQDAEANGTVIQDYSTNPEVGIDGLTSGSTVYLGVFAKDTSGNISYLSTSGNTHSFCGGGPGTNSGNAWHICDLQDLNSIRNDLTGFYLLKNHIDGSDTVNWNNGKGWVPIGDIDNRFSGEIKGDGYAVKNLFINRPTEANIGLLGRISNAAIHSLGVSNANITGGSTTGGIAGGDQNDSQITYCYVSGIISGENSTGGILGLGSDTDIAYSFNHAQVTGLSSVGGIIGLLNNNGTLTNSFSTGKTTGTVRVGGNVGYLPSGSSISRTYNTGNITATSVGGGIAGENRGTISYVWSDGNTEGNSKIGGLVGYNYAAASISYSYSAGHVRSAEEIVGGFVGQNNGSISYALATGHVQMEGSDLYKGSFCGQNSASGTLTKVAAFDRSGYSCTGINNGSADCSHITTGTIKPFEEVSFDPVFDFVNIQNSRGKNSRKISTADESSYSIFGGCTIPNATINILINDQTPSDNDVSVSTTCKNYSWHKNLNFASSQDGTFVVTVNQNGSGAKTLTLQKQTSFCKTNTSNNGAGFAGDLSTYDGTTALKAYRICTAEQFNNTRNSMTNGVFYKLENSIDLSNSFSAMLGDDSAGDCTSRFCASFEGNGFTLKNAILIKPSETYTSIFGYLWHSVNSATDFLGNFGVEDSVIIGSDKVAILAGETHDNGGGVGSITDVYVQGHLLSTTGYANAVIRGSPPLTMTRNMGYAHIIAAANGSGFGAVPKIMTETYALGNIIANSSASGFGASYCNGCYAAGTLIVSAINRVGGFSSALWNGSTIANSYATGHIIGTGGNFSAGGFTAETYSIPLLNVYSSGALIVNETHFSASVSGLVAYMNGTTATIDNSFTTASMIASGIGDEGGLIGSRLNSATATITNSFYWDHSTNPGDTCIANDLFNANPTCDEDGASLPLRMQGSFNEVPAGALREPLSSWDFTTPIWKFPPAGGLPILNWQ